jgi:hypothetical protein
MERRAFVGSLTALAAGAIVAPRGMNAQAGGRATGTAAGKARSASLPLLTVYKSPTCGCCGEWTRHMEKNGFTAKVILMEDLSQIKRDAGVPVELESCHTALVGPYAVEGHVPADLVRKMLDEKPAIAGLAVAGMPLGSPGMEQSGTKMPYSVMTFTRGGRSTVYARR